MKPVGCLVVALSVATVLGISSFSFAAGHGGFHTHGKKPTPAPTPHAMVISKVGPTSVTITDQNTSKTVNITQFTEITVNGQKAAITNLKPGMGIEITLSDSTTATRVTATEKK